MINFKIVVWFLEYVTYIYGKNPVTAFDEEVKSILEDIWNLKNKYNEITNDLNF